MNIQFIGPATVAKDGGVLFPAKLDDQALLCHFSYEVLEDVDTGAIQGDPLALFAKHQLKLLSIAEQKILAGHAHNGQVQVFTNDLPSD